MNTRGAVVEKQSEWVVAHEALSRLARQRAAADAEEGRWLLAALRSAAHVHLGFGSFSEYVERLFGYQPRSTQERLRVAETLEQLPLMSRALEQGALHWSAVRELTRVAVAENEREWIDMARGKTVRQLEELVAGKCPGDDPSSPNQPDARRHVLRFEVAPETFALFREALTALRRSTDSALDDNAALLAMARHVLGGPVDEGRASYQIALSVCPECGGGKQLSCGELVPVGDELVRMAHCDGQHVGHITPYPANDDSLLSGTLANDNAHMGAPSAARPSATQTIPPALRRAVLLRDQRRCRVPGCRNSRFLDLHHLELRSEGGQNRAEICSPCAACHDAVHRGALLIERNPTLGVRYAHADGREYGAAVQPRALDAHAKTFSALHNLGFREGEVRAALAKLRGQSELRDASTERLLRAALACLTRPAPPARAQNK